LPGGRLALQLYVLACGQQLRAAPHRRRSAPASPRAKLPAFAVHQARHRAALASGRQVGGRSRRLALQRYGLARGQILCAAPPCL